MKQLICALTAFSTLCLAVPAVLAQPGQTSPPALPQAARPDAPAAAQAPAAPSSLDGELFYQLLIGEINTRAGEAAAGFALILDAARKTNDAQLYQRAADIALQSRSGDAA
ncbi:MAG: hypothetical protein Q8M91_04060, partial [Polaromonas sp.]|nr:hypothetical protein [Polaromonas sp.]